MSDTSRQRWSARTDGTVWRSVDDEVVIMDLAPGVYFSLRGTGGDIWRMLVEQLAARYDVATAMLRADVERYVNELVTHHLATPTNP